MSRPGIKGRVTCLLINDSPDLPDDLLEPDANSPYCSNKTALLFPRDMFASAQWIKICQMTEQEVRYIVQNVQTFLKQQLSLMDFFPQKYLDLCSVEAPSGVPPSQLEPSQLESTGFLVDRPARLVVDLSTINNRNLSSDDQETGNQTEEFDVFDDEDEDGEEEEAVEESEGEEDVFDDDEDGEEEESAAEDDEAGEEDDEEEGEDHIDKEESDDEFSFTRPYGAGLKRLQQPEKLPLMRFTNVTNIRNLSQHSFNSSINLTCNITSKSNTLANSSVNDRWRFEYKDASGKKLIKCLYCQRDGFTRYGSPNLLKSLRNSWLDYC